MLHPKGTREAIAATGMYASALPVHATFADAQRLLAALGREAG